MGNVKLVCVIPDALQHVVMLRRSGIHGAASRKTYIGSRICKEAFDAALRAG